MDAEVAAPSAARKKLPGWAWALILLALAVVLGLSALGYFFVRGMVAHRGYYLNHGSHFQLQSGIRNYFEEHGRFPKSLEGPDFLGKAVFEIPKLDLRELDRGVSTKVEAYSFTDSQGRLLPEKLRDSGHWAYDPKTGTLAIDCKGINRQKNIPYYLIGQPRD